MLAPDLQPPISKGRRLALEHWQMAGLAAFLAIAGMVAVGLAVLFSRLVPKEEGR